MKLISVNRNSKRNSYGIEDNDMVPNHFPCLTIFSLGQPLLNVVGHRIRCEMSGFGSA